MRGDAALRSVANAKGARPDKIRVKLLKFGLNHDLTMLRQFYRMIKLVWHQLEVPQRRRDTAIKFLHKTKDRIECENYGDISLVAHAGKVPLKIVAMKLSTYCEAKGLLLTEQCWFCPHRSTMDMVFAVRRLQDLRRKVRVPLFLCFIELQKAYDSVDHTLVWQVLARLEVIGSPQR